MTGNIGRAECEATNIGEECKLFSTETSSRTIGTKTR